jgi:hypothetical protein
VSPIQRKLYGGETQLTEIDVLDCPSCGHIEAGPQYFMPHPKCEVGTEREAAEITRCDQANAMLDRIERLADEINRRVSDDGP